MAELTREEVARGVVTASAGNHGQGWRWRPARSGFPPAFTCRVPRRGVKQIAVRQHGGDLRQILLTGDGYDEAFAAARDDERTRGPLYVHAYDDLLVMAGQGTLADEVVLSGHGPFDAVYLQIGGGGEHGCGGFDLAQDLLAEYRGGRRARHRPGLHARSAGSGPARSSFMTSTFSVTAPPCESGHPPLHICRQTLKRVETVTNAEVSSAIHILWESLRCISEPSGAMGLAAALKNRAALAGKRVLIIVSGANIDFLQLGLIAQFEGAASATARALRIRIPERVGTMLALLDRCFAGINVTDFQYGKKPPG